MDEKKKAKLAAKGWVIVTVEEFLGLTPEERIEVERMVKASNETRKTEPQDS